MWFCNVKLHMWFQELSNNFKSIWIIVFLKWSNSLSTHVYNLSLGGPSSKRKPHGDSVWKVILRVFINADIYKRLDNRGKVTGTLSHLPSLATIGPSVWQWLTSEPSCPEKGFANVARWSDSIYMNLQLNLN